MSLRRTLLITLALPCLLATGTAQTPQPPTARLDRLVLDAAVDEISGLAASRRHDGILWAHNDSGNPAELYAIDAQGRRAATLRLRGITNNDWEDLAIFRDAGRDWLLVADVGDNGGLRGQPVLHILAEPEELADAEVEVARSLRFRWPDGPRDCEAVAVDIGERAIYLITKKRVPPELFRLPLDADTGHAPIIAERVGLVGHISQPSAADLQRNPVFGRHRARITSMDISADGRRMVVLNYLQARLYRRADGEDWADAVQQVPLDLFFPWLAQAEAIALSGDGNRLWIGTERLPSPILEMTLPDEDGH